MLIEALQDGLDGAIETSAPIAGLRRTEEGWLVELERAGEGSPIECAAVLLALPSHKMASLEIKTTPALEVSSLAEVYYPPVASVVLGFRRADVAHPLDGFGMLIPEKEGFNILGALFSSSLFPNRAPEGQVAITCYIGGARAPLLPLNTSEALDRKSPCSDLQTILGVRGRPDVSARRRLSRGHSPIQPRLRKIPRVDERHGIEGAGPVCGRTRPRRHFPGRFHRLRPPCRGENPDVFGLEMPGAPSAVPHPFRV